MPAESQKKKKVLITGFGPFGVHVVNASWVAVQRLATLRMPDDIELITQEIPVEYKAVGTLLPSLWKSMKPDLVIHVGVSGIASEITLEQQAHNDGYDKIDNSGSCPEHNCCVHGADDCIVSGIDMQNVCDEINSSELKAKAIVSHDPGRYLCDFSYYTSLNVDKSRTAFIHVPPLDRYSADDLAEGLKCAVLSMLKQLS